jgi:hypothetical protein
VGKGSGAVVCVALGANIAFAAAHLVAQLHLYTVLGSPVVGLTPGHRRAVIRYGGSVGV